VEAAAATTSSKAKHFPILKIACEGFNTHMHAIVGGWG